MTDPESIVVRWTPVDGASRRFVFKPRVDGYYRREQVWTEDRWRTVGTEVVECVGFENVPADAVD